jgi:hypothetical protein
VSRFVILVKSHLPDLPYVERLLDSFARHNADGVDLHLVVPPDDSAAFARLAADHVVLSGEDAFAEHLTHEPVAGFSPGYINQEIVKLCFWESGAADNYLCLDSDAEFVRDFHVADFMADETTPFTFLSEDSELQAEPDYYASHWVARRERLRRIQEEIGLTDAPLRTVHGHAVFSATVLRAFRDRFLAPRGWDYVDALALAPYEPTWYSLWLQKDRTIPIVEREPVIKTFHDPTQQLDYVLRGLDADDVARGYVAVVVNSNYSRGTGLASLADAPSTVAAEHYSTGDLARAALRRSLDEIRARLSGRNPQA